MLTSLFKRFSGTHYRRFIKRCKPIIERINALEKEYQLLSDDALRGKTAAFMDRYQQGETLDDLLPEAFAVVKNTARRLNGQTITVCDKPLKWEMVHYDVQLIGGVALHEGKIAEMATGEGKTLVATLPLYLNALSGRNCQLVTTNDYLARRDAEWMGYIYKFLGLTVGCIQNQISHEDRRAAYQCNITYGTASELGFDYLRDNGMATRKEDQVQRDHFFCMVDEVDSILIDEARTPLIISGPANETREAPFMQMKGGVERLVNLQQKLCNRLVAEAKEILDKPDEDRAEAAVRLLQVRLGMPKNRQLNRMIETGEYRKLLDKYDLEMSSDLNKTTRYRLKEELYFVIDEKQHQADLTEKGRNTLRPDNPDAFMLPDLPTQFVEVDRDASLTPEQKQQRKQAMEQEFIDRSEEIHCLSQLLRAYCLYERDQEYVVQEGKVQIVDQNTGRIMPGRRWSEGLHQAVEAKENVTIEKETKTYATITIQNYFRLYEKLAGMTGTAETEAGEFYDIYKLSVMAIPTHKACIRKDLNDVIFKTRREKYNAAVKDIEEAHRKGQPVLVGTASVEASEVLAKMLKRANIPHAVLNAKFHQQEAEIIARAGQRGAVTIATNMAGRGTDIKLGDGVAGVGGLFVLGTERHDSRRIDRQLRGRCSRQGDPGMSRFMISLEDDLMRLFANAGPISRILEKSFQEGEALEHPLLNRSIESAQKKVEGQNYSIRKRLLQYDDVLNRQREVIYGIRNDAIHNETPREIIFEMIDEELRERLDVIYSDAKGKPEGAAVEGFLQWINTHFPVSLKLDQIEGLDENDAVALVLERIQAAYAEREQFETPEALKGLERYVVIRAIDSNWQDHLTEMEDLRRAVGLRGYGQKDPLNEYKSEAYVYFEEMMGRVRNGICTGLFRSATNLSAFQNMLSRLSGKAQATGPAEGGSSLAQAAAGAARAEGGGAPRPSRLPQVTVKRDQPKVGRNDPCPCGSGKKYKKCCGQNEG